MTPLGLASLPIGSLIELDGDQGKIVQSGQTVYIEWDDCTSIIDTASPGWKEFIGWLKNSA